MDALWILILVLGICMVIGALFNSIKPIICSLALIISYIIIYISGTFFRWFLSMPRLSPMEKTLEDIMIFTYFNMKTISVCCLIIGTLAWCFKIFYRKKN